MASMDDNNDLFGTLDKQPPPARAPARPADPLVQAAKRPAASRDGSESYSAADIEVLEGLEPVRRRPGMYIGGTDDKAMHHLFAEVIDNSMDEAVAGHATFIDVELSADGYLSVTDNGRGIPVDPHPKFKKPALEVIMTTLHSGGKFDSKVYETSGGLHGVGVSVVNALSDHLEVEVARGRQLYRQKFSRGIPVTGLEQLGEVHNRRGTRIRFHPDEQIFGKGAAFEPARLYRMTRSKAYLFGGVEIRWSCDPSLIKEKDQTPAKAEFHFPGGLKDYLKASLGDEFQVTREIFAGKSDKQGGHGSLEWAVTWFGGDGFINSYCNTIPTGEGGTHEAGFRNVLTRGLRAYADLIGNKRASIVTSEDVMISAAGMLSVFIREPEFVGQTKDRLATIEAVRIVETAIRDPFDHWLADNPQEASKLLEWVIARADERVRRRQEKEVSRKSAVRKLRLPGKLADCTQNAAAGAELFIVEGDFGRRLGQAGARPRQPGGSAVARQDPQRRQRRQRQACRQPADLRPGPGAGLRHAVEISRRGFALRPRHHHDRRRRRRRPHRVAADHLLLSGNAEPGPRRPSLSGGAAALFDPPGRQGRLCPRRRAQGRTSAHRIHRACQGRDRPLQGAGRDDGSAAQGDHHGPEEAHASQGRCKRNRFERTKDRVDELMGTKPEARFRFIQERAEFAETDVLDI